MMRLLKTWVIIIFSCSILTACGFHLRGEKPLPSALKHINVSAKTSSGEYFAERVRILLSRLHAEVIQHPNPKVIQLIILNDDTSQILGNVSASTQTRQITFVRTVDAQLSHFNGDVIAGPWHLNTTHVLTVNNSQLLSAGFRQQSLKRDMQNELLNQLLLRLSADHTRQQLKKNETHA